MAPPTLARGGPGPRPGYKPGMVGGKGKVMASMAGAKRHRKLPKDTIRGISSGDIRRLARRGGVKRISQGIYPEIRLALAAHLREIVNLCVVYTEYRAAKTVTINDVLQALKQIGKPIWGFDPDTYDHSSKKKASQE